MAKAEEEQKNAIVRGVTYFQDSVEEIKKVHTPSRQETLQATILVLIMVVLFASFLGLSDMLLGSIMESLYQSA